MVLLSAALFSTGGAAIKTAKVDCGFDSWQVACFRSAVAALFVLAAVPAARRALGPRTWFVGVFYAATLVLFVLANTLTTAANTIFLQSMAPLYVLLSSPLLLREPVHRRDFGYLALFALGLSLFFVAKDEPSTTAPNPFLGNLLAIFSGIGWASVVLGLRWLARTSPDASLSAVLAGNTLAATACLPLALGGTGVPMTPGAWATIGYLGVLQIGVAYLLLAWAMPRLVALEVTVLLLVEPALNPLWAWLVHDERPAPLALGGGAVIVGTLLLRAKVEARAGS
jgi:drug/metabolite transporter (DMT)-like permease